MKPSGVRMARDHDNHSRGDVLQMAQYFYTCNASVVLREVRRPQERKDMDREAVYDELNAMKKKLVELAVELDVAGERGAASSLDDAYAMIREAQKAIVEGWVD